MPINFQPAEPLAPSISEGYGAAEQFDQSLPVMQRYQHGIADAYLQGAALRQRAQQASSALQLQGAEQTHALDQRSYEANLHAQIQQQQMAHQSDMQAQHAQLQDQLAANQLSRGEQLRLQRLQEARGQVQDMVNTGSLTADEGRAALTQIQTGIDPLQQRQHRFQMQAQEFQYRQAQQQAARQDQLWNERQRYHASGLQDRLTSIVDPMTGERHQFYLDEHSSPHLLFEAPARGAGGAMASGGSQQAGGTGAAGAGSAGTTAGRGGAAGRSWQEMTTQEQNHIYEHAIGEMRHEQQNTQNDRPAWMDNREQFDAELQARINRRVAIMNAGQPRRGQVSPEQVQAAELQNELLAARRADPRAPEHVHQLQARVNVRNRRLNQELAATPPAPLVPNAAEAEGDRPFTAELLGGMNPVQRDHAEAMNGFRAIIEAAGSRDRAGRTLDDGRRQTLLHNLNAAQRILSRYGSEAAMPPAEARRYADLRQTFMGVQGPAPARQQGAQYGEGVWPRFNQGLVNIGTWAEQNRLTPARRPEGGPFPPPPITWGQ